MEISEFTVRGAKNYVLFTGKKYIGFNNWYGVFAIAERTQSHVDPETAKTVETFMLTYTDEISVRYFKKYITEREQKYISKEVCFNEQLDKNLSDWAILDLNIIPRNIRSGKNSRGK